MVHDIKVTDENHPLYGKEVTGYLFYHDINHTGDSPDLFRLQYKGQYYNALSTQIDVEHYKAQQLAAEIARLGANVGDTVMIVQDGGGAYSGKFDRTIPHKITRISSGGYVEFDGGSANGGADISRPKVQIV